MTKTQLRERLEAFGNRCESIEILSDLLRKNNARLKAEIRQLTNALGEVDAQILARPQRPPQQTLSRDEITATLLGGSRNGCHVGRG